MKRVTFPAGGETVAGTAFQQLLPVSAIQSDLPLSIQRRMTLAAGILDSLMCLDVGGVPFPLYAVLCALGNRTLQLEVRSLFSSAMAICQSTMFTLPPKHTDAFAVATRDEPYLAALVYPAKIFKILVQNKVCPLFFCSGVWAVRSQVKHAVHTLVQSINPSCCVPSTRREAGRSPRVSGHVKHTWVCSAGTCRYATAKTTKM
mmetsp:Transcript_53692/g.95739  ORF Transcript_53692/g.95739 Transcript_53692/m.95739 type:complete len:203 (+) Transcript_53692:144-752(+)